MSGEDDLEKRLDSFFNDPVILEMKDKVGLLPIWGMMGAGLSFIIADYGIKTKRFAARSPLFARLGMAVFGGIGGLQAGFWKLRYDYYQLDPTGERLQRGRDLFEELKQRKQGHPVQQEMTVKTNQYGDPIEEEK